MRKYVFALAALFFSFGTHAQTLDTEALKDYDPSLVRRVWEVARYVKLDAAQQQQLARAFASEDSCFVAMLAGDGGIQSVRSRNRIQKMYDNSIAALLDEEQLNQYYRGVYDTEANAEGIATANRLQKQYNLTDQNWKFIRIAFYKIGLERRVIRKLLADKPKEAARRIAKIQKEQLATIEAKGGIRVDAEGTTVTVVRPFDPNALYKE